MQRNNDDVHEERHEHVCRDDVYDAGLLGHVRYGHEVHDAHESDVSKSLRHVRRDVHELRHDVRKDGQRQRDDDALRRDVQALRRFLHHDVQDADGSLVNVSGYRTGPSGSLAKSSAQQNLQITPVSQTETGRV